MNWHCMFGLVTYDLTIKEKGQQGGLHPILGQETGNERRSTACIHITYILFCWRSAATNGKATLVTVGFSE